MNVKICLAAGVAVVFGFGAVFARTAVPLVSGDPFFSVWSEAEKLTDVETSHWSGARQPISITLEADGKTWRLCGLEPKSVPALPQTGLEVRPLQTVYTFAEGAMKVKLVFTTAKLVEDLDVFSRPVTYVTAYVQGAKKWELKTSISPALATNDDKAQMVTNRCTVAGLPAMSVGRKEQRPLSESGDLVRCNWGWAWLVGPSAAKDGEAYFMLAYDDVKSIRYFDRELPAWWRRRGMSFKDMLERAAAERKDILAKCDAFDAEMSADMNKVGGDKYAYLASLIYRHTFAACKLVAYGDDQPFYLSKEEGSNGCIGTVDVLYPQSPQMVFTSPTLMRAMMAPVLVYAAHKRWPWPFAPHDLGRYPLATGQLYGGGEKGRNEGLLMPVEESGNMIIAFAAIAQAEGNAEFAAQWWPLIQKWAQYLEKFGFDPGDQLCTDDFMGHLAHNSNLAIKSIIALACYGRLAEALGDAATAKKYTQLAKDMVPKWMEAAKGGRAGSYRLAYDKPDTWSSKYNLAWDRALGLGLFPPEVAEAEMRAYKTFKKPYGLPLDCRRNWMKCDWAIWCSTLTGKKEDMTSIIDGIYRYASETKTMSPFSDLILADAGRPVRNYWLVARSVMGGAFMPMICDGAIWKKYASRGKTKTGRYSPLYGGAKRKPKALQIMLDGVRADTIENGHAPNMRMLRDGKWAPGYKCAWSLTATTVRDAPAVSSVNHASIATGVTAKKTKVYNNPGLAKGDWKNWPSWTVRLVRAQPQIKAFFAFSWWREVHLSPDPKVEFARGTDASNAITVPKRLAAADCPDAIMWFMDAPDECGHACGYYPYSAHYLHSVYFCDKAIGAALKAIASRPTFDEEDWMIVVTTDHGGYERGHGTRCGHSWTIPLLVAGRNMPQGRMPGMPRHFDSAVTLLHHFGVDTSGMNLDGKPLGVTPAAKDPARDLKDGLAVYLPFDGNKVENGVVNGPKGELHGPSTAPAGGGFIGGYLKVAAATNGVTGVELKGSEKLEFENGADFAMALWVRMDPVQDGDPVIAGNEDWRSGRNPGVAMIGSRKVGGLTNPGVCFNGGGANKQRVILGQYEIPPRGWTFYAVTHGSDGMLRFYQGGTDGYLYHIAEQVPWIKMQSGLPFYVGQDGTGRYAKTFKGDIDDFALWTRELSYGDIRKIYEAGRKGIPIGDLLVNSRDF